MPQGDRPFSFVVYSSEIRDFGKKEGVKKVLHSAQVGKTCEYKPGNAMMVFTVTQDGKKESRIQPNNPNGCPKDDQKE